MNPKIEMLALCKAVDDICKDKDIDPALVIQWMLDEEMFELSDYFPDEDEEE